MVLTRTMLFVCFRRFLVVYLCVYCRSFSRGREQISVRETFVIFFTLNGDECAQKRSSTVFIDLRMDVRWLNSSDRFSHGQGAE